MRADLKEKLEEYIEYIRLIKERTVLVATTAIDVSSMENDFTVFAAYYFPAVETKPVLIDLDPVQSACDNLSLTYEELARACEKLAQNAPDRYESLERLEELFALHRMRYANDFWLTNELINIQNPFKNEKSNKIYFDRGRIIGDDLMWQGRVTRATKRRAAKEMRWLRNHRKT